MSFEEDAYRYAVRNAFQHSGKADLAAVIGKVVALHKDIDLKKSINQIRQIVEQVNALSSEQLEKEFQKFESGYELKIPLKKVGLQDLEWANSEPVVTRWAPNPSTAPHFGHIRPAYLSYAYAKKYNGKFILRFDDTDPKFKTSLGNAQEVYLEDLKWLGIKPDLIVYASDRIEIYHSYMRKAIELGKAYVCTCDKEKFKELKKTGEVCPCRELDVNTQLERFNKMLKYEYKEGEAVLRIKTDIKHPDPSIREWPAARIVDKPTHPRVKDIHLWPTYNFASAIDDHLLGVTLIIRGQDHTQNTTKQKYLYDYFGWKFPHAFHHGKIFLKGFLMSKSKIKKLMLEEKMVDDDPRLSTVKALRRRGFHSEALKDFIIEIGVKGSDTKVEPELLALYNKKYLQDVPEFSFVEDLMELSVDFTPKFSVPTNGKSIELKEGSQNFLVPKNKMAELKVGEVFRLKKAYVVKLKEISEFQASADFIGFTSTQKAVIPWMVDHVDVEIVLANNTRKAGICERGLEKIPVNTVVLLDGIGYCRVDEKPKTKVILRFAHK